MAILPTDNRILESDEEVGIPELLRHKAQRHVRHCVRIVVECRGVAGKYAKCNGFKLTKEKDNNDGYPTQELDDILQTIMCCVNAKYAERLAGDENTEEVDFRVVFEQRHDGNRSRPTAELEAYSPDGPDMPFAMAGMGGESNDIHDRVIENLMNLVDKLALRLDDAHVHVISMSDRTKEIFEPLTKLMAMSHANQVTGMEMQRRAMEYMYSTKRIEEEELGRDRRTEKWMEWLKKPTDTAMKQFGRYMRVREQRLGKDDDDDDDDDKADDAATNNSKGDANPKPKTDGANGSAKKPQARPGADGPTDEPDADTIENPIANMAQSLGQLLTPGQWAEGSSILTKKQFTLFAQMLESKTDAQTIERYDKVAAMPPLKLIQLLSVLDDRQREGMEHLRTFIAKAKEGWEDEGEPN